MRNASWTLSNLCRQRPIVDFEKISNCIPTLCQVILSNTDNVDIVSDSIQALSYISDHGEAATRLILSTNLTEFLMKLSMSADTTLQTPAVRIIGNCLSGSDEQTQFLIDRGILPLLLQLTEHTRPGLRKEACWAISNITAGSASQV